MSGSVRIDPVHSLRPDQALMFEVSVWLVLFLVALLAWHVAGVGLAVAGAPRGRRGGGVA